MVVGARAPARVGRCQRSLFYLPLSRVSLRGSFAYSRRPRYNLPMMRTLRALVTGLGLLALAGVAAFVGFIWRIDRYGHVDGARPADVIIILGARVRPDGQPGSDLLSRTYHALDLYQAGYAKHIICTGGFAGDRLSAAAVACRFATEHGVPPGQAWLAAGTSSTAEDAAAAAEVMRARGWQTAILVSHPLHLYRAAWHFRRLGIVVYPSPTTTEVERIAWPLRLYYASREAVAILWSVAEGWGMPRAWATWVRSWWSRLSRQMWGESL
jgi:uncharacterized SAM-binding protein YcdF (DUF218 family)